MARFFTALHVLLLLGCHSLRAADIDAYWRDRASLIQQEKDTFLGSKITLTADEQRANTVLMAAKYQEFDNCFDPLCFPPARHFFFAKSDIEASQVFNIIKRMPKGAALHGHDTGMVSTEWLVQNATYRNGLYACARTSSLQPAPPLGLDLIRTVFSSSSPASNTCQEGTWRNVALLRSSSGAEEVDKWFEHHFTLITDNPEEKYPDVNVAWEAFMGLFEVTGGLISYTPMFRDYYVQTLQEMLDDNVQYLELRGLLLPTYNLDGSTIDTMNVAAMYQEAGASFMANQAPGDWLGARFIYAPTRQVDNATADVYIDTAIQLVQSFPDYIAGFDLVGQEDKGKPYTDFIAQLLRLRDTIPDIKYFFHAGETNWQGLTDMNILDALLLNTTRIGHGYAISKHPVAQQMARDKGVAIEVNPISNQVLRLVDDLRNHPVSSLIATDFPIVVSCDDPSFWGAKGLSYDFYQMFMGIAGRDADLRFLKQLAINSINYSAMDDVEKACALEAWGFKWDEFIAGVLGDTTSTETREHRAECTSLWRRRVQLQTNKLIK